ncbi:MAG: hypothetical protein IH987_17180 [Planctomycetes bacterium]|nr:hypothetical protein [Planctomycetota bacterium]
MLWLNEDAVLLCDHRMGVVGKKASQDWVRIEKRPVLVATDPERVGIVGCPIAPPLKPCLLTLRVDSGYSGFIRIGTASVCLDILTGLTDGSPPGTVKYTVSSPGQAFVNQRGAL